MNSHFQPSTFRKWLHSSREESFLTSKSFFPESHLTFPWLWMATSGTTAASTVPPRFIAHTRQSLFNSAISVCEFLNVTSLDRWARVLPTHHMGGLSLDVRAEVSGCQVIGGAPAWDPVLTAEWLRAEKATLVSVVPTQIYDWVKNRTPAPASLRLVIAGGDRLDRHLETEAKKLGWPLVSSYGLTETASMIACQPIASAASNGLAEQSCKDDWLSLLPHAEVKLNSAGNFSISCTSLFVAELNWVNPEQKYVLNEYTGLAGLRSWESSDFGEVIDQKLKILGRTGNLIKVMGSMIDLAELDQKIGLLLKENHLPHTVVFTAKKDVRKGHLLQLVAEGTRDIQIEKLVLALWNQNCPGLWRVDNLIWVNLLPRTEIGKLKRNSLMPEGI